MYKQPNNNTTVYGSFTITPYAYPSTVRQTHRPYYGRISNQSGFGAKVWKFINQCWYPILLCCCLIIFIVAPVLFAQHNAVQDARSVFSTLTTSAVLSVTTDRVPGLPVLTVSLREALHHAGAENLGIKEAEARHQLALAQEARAGAWFLPVMYGGLTLYAASGTVMNARGEFFQNVNPNTITAQTGIAGEWKLADGIFLSKAAELRAQAASEDIRTQQLRVLLSVITVYFDLMAAQERRRLLGETLSLNERLYQQMSLQQGAGIIAKSDVLLVQSSLYRSKLLMQQASADILRRSAELSVLMNLPRAHQIITPDSMFVPVRLNDSALTDSLLRQTLQDRPELKALHLEQSALQNELESLTTGRLIPSFTANLSSNLLGEVFQPQYGRITSLIGVSWSFPFADVVGKGQVQQIRSTLALRSTQEKFVEAQLYRELSTLASTVIALQPAVTFAREEVSASFEALRQSIERQKLGTAKPLEVLQTYDYLIRAQTDYITVIAEYNKAEYSLFFSRGMVNTR